jgi:beta-galactosidase
MIFGGEIYSGWYKKWGESADPVSTLDDFIYMYDELLRNHHSFSVYLVHGGTNFGLTAGANYVYNSKTDFAGVITSYDYESPIT